MKLKTKVEGQKMDFSNVLSLFIHLEMENIYSWIKHGTWEYNLSPIRSVM